MPNPRIGFSRLLAAGIALVIAVVLGLVASSTIGSADSSPPANQGEDGFGMTEAFLGGHVTRFTYSHGFFCDTAVQSAADTKCEVGEKWKNAPSGDHDPLFITVPLGFTPQKMAECPANLVCIDHPKTVDLTRLEPALKPLYPDLTDAQLTEALKNFTTPEHDHFITTRAGGDREWWDVYVVGVTSKKVYRQIQNAKSYGYIKKLIAAKDPHVLGPIPSNIFLFFAVK